MPPLESADLIDQCLLYTIAGKNRQNEPVLNYPTVQKCRWTQNIAQQGREFSNDAASFDARAALCGCPDGIPVGSMIWYGNLSDITGTADPPVPDSTEELYEVISVSSAKDLKGRSVRHELGLKRWNKGVPFVKDAGD